MVVAGVRAPWRAAADSRKPVATVSFAKRTFEKGSTKAGYSYPSFYRSVGGGGAEKPEVTQLSNGDLAVHPATSPANRLSGISQVPGTPCEGSASSSLCLFSWKQFADCFLGDLAVQLEKVKIIEAPKVLLPQARGRSSGLRSHPGRADATGVTCSR
uniref:Uncharacterized protein n=1 Tax=Rousettus aegyptiacus TaxID=9407 RepID=A0A7J8DXH3_ROUAE|nr:hypothetical protein HJG63_008308 [Rousettus aegyptiacus]